MSTSFIVNLADLTKILEQIRIAERHAAGENLIDIIGKDSALLPLGLRTVDGSYNHLLPGTELDGAADQLFPRLLPPTYLNDADGDTITLVPNGTPGAPPGGVVLTNTNYDPTIPGSHSVADADPRIISNLIVDQSTRNPAAVEAWFANPISVDAWLEANPGKNPVRPGEIVNVGVDVEVTDADLLFIPNQSPDIGLSPPNSSWMTLFGQFFDHGLDLVTKGNNGTVYIPLQADDPLYDKGADGIVSSDDGFGADGVFGTVDDRPNFMALTRATTFVDPVTGLKTETRNTTTPFVDQNQTYTSHASHQVFLRDYKFSVDTDNNGVADARAVNTGRLLDGANGGIANWAETKAQAQTMLGLQLNDFNISDVPLLVTDQYGKFKPGANGFAQVVVTVSVVSTTTGAVIGTVSGNFTAEGVAGGLDLANIQISNVQLPPGVTLPPLAAGQAYKVATVGTGHAFLDDIAHHAAPTAVDHDRNPATPRINQTADTDFLDYNADGVVNQTDVDLAVTAGQLTDADGSGTIDVNDLRDVNLDGVINSADLVADDHNPLTYDNEMLDAHFITGDGRGNENIGLTAVHSVFHAEHNRIVEANKDTLVASGDAAVVNEWLAAGANGVRNAITQVQLDAINALTDPAAKAAAIDALNWDGERMFQAARFVTEMQYQHLVFEEFARRIQPNVDAFVFTNSADLDPAIVAEFAHTVYRFGHSMLSDTVDRLDNNLELVAGTTDQIGLIEAFLNPQAFTASGVDNEEMTGAIVRGMSRQVSNELDEFVVGAVRSNLLGLPLDLAALNIARGRDTGIPTLNEARAKFYASTNDAQLKPYTSWFDFAANLKHPESIINFIAAYGTHSTITSALTVDAKRDAAMELVFGVDVNGDGIVPATQDRLDFVNGTGAWNAQNSGLNSVDFWIGGLAEQLMEFGGMLGSTFNYVFETQLESLQNGDRFYYLSRTQGMNLLNLLEPNTFADLIMRNTDLGDLHATHLPAEIMEVADMILELDPLVKQEDYNGAAAGLDPTWGIAIKDLITPKVVKTLGTVDIDGNGFVDGNILKFSGGEHVVLGGTEGNDKIYGDKGIDTLWGDGGDDYLNAGMESDQVFGGDGDDIIEDPFGDDFLRGEAGNDVIANGHGLDLLFGGEGNDFMAAATDTTEFFGGPGNDFILGGTAADALLGNEGDDWLEGGEGFDSLSGENSELFFNSPIVGHDVLNGQGNDTDYDGENGDDIMFQGAGIQRNNGMEGFDWVTHQGDTQAANTDLSNFLGAGAVTPAFILRDRFDSIEGLTGWNFDDTLTGASRLIVAGGGFDSKLTQEGVDRIRGLDAVIGAAADGVNPLGNNAANAVVLTSDKAFAGGEIILGGDGSDTIRGNLGDDIIDGDAYLHVRIAIHQNKNGTGPVLGSVETLKGVIVPEAGQVLPTAWVGKSLDSLMLSGVINPGQLEIVREILYDNTNTATNDAARDLDVAVFGDDRINYTVEGEGTVIGGKFVAGFDENNDGFITVTHVNPLIGNDGVDYLKNIEILQFGDFIEFIDPTIVNAFATGELAITSNTPSQLNVGDRLTVSLGTVADANGLPPFSAFRLVWQVEQTPGAGDWVDLTDPVTGDTIVGPTFTPTPAFGLEGFSLRVVGRFTDNHNVPEIVFSAPTAPLAAPNTDPTITAPNAGLATTITVAENSTGIIADVNATDVETPAGLTYSLLGDDAGRFTINAGTGVVSFVSAPNFEAPTDVGANNSYNVTVRVTDAGGGFDEQALTVNVTNVNEAPTGIVSINATSPAIGQLLTASNTLADPDSPNVAAGNLAVSYQWQQSVNGVTWVNIAGATTSTFTPGAAQQGQRLQVVATYTDGGNFVQSVASAMTAAVGVGNAPPIVSATNAVNLLEDTQSAAITIGATDPNLDTLTYAVKAGAGPTKGGVTFAGDTFRYTPTLNANGADTFTIVVSDGRGGTAEQVVSVNITPVNDAPTGGLNIVSYTPVRTGTTQASLTATNNLADVDGLAGIARFQWQRQAANGTFSNIAGATAATATGLSNGVFRVISTYTDQHGLQTVVSPQTARIGTSGNDTLVAATGVEFVLGLGGNDVLTGGTGNDVVDAGDGTDTVKATVGDGNDTYFGGSGVDTYDLSATSAAATVNLQAGTASSAETGTDTLDGFENVIGSAGANTITGDNGANRLDGQGGNDTLVGGGGTDTLIGGAGDDTLLGEGGNDTLTGGAGNDRLDGGAGTDSLDGGDGDDVLLGDGGNDTLTAGAGNDRLDGGAGSDTMAGGAGNDTYVVGENGDVVTEGANAGIDTIETTQGTFNLGATQLGVIGTGPFGLPIFGQVAVYGNIENLTYTGNAGFNATGNGLANTITGGSGADTINGGGGDDRLNGRGGNDTYNVATGNDTIVLQAGFGNDTAISFDANPGGGGQDRIDISSYNFTAANIGTQIIIQDLGNDMLIRIGADSLRLQGVNGNGANTITADDFLFT